VTSAIQSLQALATGFQVGSGGAAATAGAKNPLLNALSAVTPSTTSGASSSQPDPSQSAGATQAEQAAELSRINTELGLREAKAKLAQGDESKWLEILSLLIPVMINGGKINAEQVDWWKKMVPALNNALTK
jgi:hypothetical protein